MADKLTLWQNLLRTLVILFLMSACSAAPADSRARATSKKQALFQGPQVFLTVSPLASYKNEGGTIVLLDRLLEMHWANFEDMPNDKIGIFNEDPATLSASELRSKVIEEYPANATSGSYKTSVRYERRSLNATMEKCLGFWVGYIQGENDQATVLQSNCLKVQPTWMNDLRNEIKNVPLHSLMIPGTHNAGSWIYYEGLPLEGVIIEYTYCHEDSIYEQLIHGIRSLDVRVGHYPATTEKFYINHDAVRIQPFRTLVEDVKRFVLETNEIVFLDFHRFPVGFTGPEVHHELLTYLQEEFGDLLASKSLSLSATPETLWEFNKRVVLFYGEDALQVEYDVLRPGVNQAWGDTNKLEELEPFLESAVEDNGCRGRAWAAMAQLTSTVEDIILRPSFGIRGFSDLANNHVSQWYQRESWYSKSMIVALDFYMGTNVIETAIEVNKNHANVCV